MASGVRTNDYSVVQPSWVVEPARGAELAPPRPDIESAFGRRGVLGELHHGRRGVSPEVCEGLGSRARTQGFRI